MPSPLELAKSLLNETPEDQSSGVSPWHAAQSILSEPDEPEPLGMPPPRLNPLPSTLPSDGGDVVFDLGRKQPTSAQLSLSKAIDANPEYAATAAAEYGRDEFRRKQKVQDAILKQGGVGRLPDAGQIKQRLERSWLQKVPVIGDALTTGATGLFSGLADLGATATKTLGADDLAADIRHQSHAAMQGDAERYDPESFTGWLAERERNIANAVPKMMIAGGKGAPVVFGLDGAADAAQAADDAGVTGTAKYSYVAAVGAANAVQGWIFGKLFGGAKVLPKSTIMATLKAHGAEIAKGAIGGGAVAQFSRLSARLAEVDKTEWTPTEFVMDFVNAGVESGAMHGAGQAARAWEFRRSNPEQAQAILSGEPSRSTFEQAGLGDIKSKADREAFKSALAETDGAEVRQSVENSISNVSDINRLQEQKTALEPNGVDGQAGSLPDVQLSSAAQRIAANLDVHAKQSKEMTPDQMRQALVTHPLTGMPNERAYKEKTRKAIQVQMDTEGLKYFNDEVGKKLGLGDKAGDEVLKAMAQVVHEAIPDDAYNTHGDTFIAEFDTPEQAAAARAEIKQRLAETEVHVELPDGTVKVYKGIGAAWGEGDTLERAHGDMEADKVRGVERGERAPRGEAPRSLVEVTAERLPDNQGRSPAQEGEVQQAAAEPAVAGGAEGAARHGDLDARAKELELKVGGLSKEAKTEKIDTVEHLQSGIPMPKEVQEASKGTLTELKNFFLGTGGESAPLTTRANRQAGEAVTRHAVSQGAAEPIAQHMEARIFGEKGMNDKVANDLGAILAEDNLRDLKRTAEKPEAVKSLVGPDGYFETEAEYQKAKREYADQLKEAKRVMNPFMDRQYRLLKGMEADAELPSRGLETGVRINLMAVRPEEGGGVPAPGGPGGDLGAPRKNYNVFSKRATGAASLGYETDFRKILRNSINRTYEKGTRVEMFNKLVEGGLAQWGERGATPPTEIVGEKAIRIETKIDGQEKALYLKESLVREVRQAMDTDMAATKSKVANLINTIQIKGPTDFLYHTANLYAGVMSAPSGKSIAANLARKIPGVNAADAAVRITKSAIEIAQGSPEIKARLAKLAEIGALRAEHDGGLSHKALETIDRAARVALDKMYDDLVSRGLKVDNETSRREFVNQVGQYNTRLQSEWMARLKTAGFAPFVTAGQTFNRIGRQALTGGSRGEATSKGAAAQLRAEQIAGNIIAPVVAAMAINYLAGSQGKNIPLGAIDLQEKDDQGRDQYLDLLKWTLVRRGMGSTGLSAVEDSIRNNRSPATTADEAAKGVVNAAIHPFVGPMPHFTYSALTGREPALGAPSAPSAKPGENQTVVNAKWAAAHVNPILTESVKGISDATKTLTGKPIDKRQDDKTIAQTVMASVKGAVGIKRAKRETSRAMDLARDFLARRQPSGENATEDDRDSRIVRARLTEAIREGKDPQEAIDEAVKTGDVTEKQAWLSSQGAKMDWRAATFKGLDIVEAKKVLDVATPEERKAWADMFDDKITAKAKAIARPRPLSGTRDKPLADRVEKWRVEVDDAVRMLNEAGVSAEDALAAYRYAMRGKSGMAAGVVALRRKLQ